MQGLPVQLLTRSEIRATISLTILIVLLCSGTILPHLSVQLGIVDNPEITPATPRLLWLTLPVVVVALLGITAIYLQARCRTIEAARGLDSHAALHDPLTGAANRRHFEQRLDQLIADTAPSHALIMIDLDRFNELACLIVQQIRLNVIR